MRQTLFYIPFEVSGVPLFGLGVLLALWAVVSLVVLVVLVRRQGWNADTLGYLPVLGMFGVVIAFLLPAMGEANRGLPVRGYGVMLLLGVVSGVALAVHRAHRRGLDPEIIYSLAFAMCLAGIACARVFYIVEYWPQYSRSSWGETLTAVINITQGGLVVYGAAIGALAALLVFARLRRLNVLALADLAAPCMMVGLAFGRIGCFLNGCCYGGVCQELPWSVCFPWNSPPHVRQIEQHQLYVHGLQFDSDFHRRNIITAVEPGSAAEQQGLKPGDRIVNVGGEEVATGPQGFDAEQLLLGTYGEGAEVSILTADSQVPKQWTLSSAPPCSLPVQPAQLYSAFDAVLIALFLLACEPFCRRSGELFAIMFIVYPITRFLIEIIRTDESAVFGTQLSISQNISLVLFLAAVGLLVYLAATPVLPWLPAPPHRGRDRKRTGGHGTQVFCQ